MPEIGRYSETPDQGTSAEVLDGFEWDFSHRSTAYSSVLWPLMFVVMEDS